MNPLGVRLCPLSEELHPELGELPAAGVREGWRRNAPGNFTSGPGSGSQTGQFLPMGMMRRRGIVGGGDGGVEEAGDDGASLMSERASEAIDMSIAGSQRVAAS